MTKIVVVTSGKGGVGKTTTSASFSSGLVTISASSAKCMAMSAPVSMPAGESHTM